jgi:hypothetical protein
MVNGEEGQLEQVELDLGLAPLPSKEESILVKEVPIISEVLPIILPENLPILGSIPVPIPGSAPIPIPVPAPIELPQAEETLPPKKFDQYNMDTAVPPPRASDRIIEDAVIEDGANPKKAWPSPEPAEYAKPSRSQKLETDDIMDIIFGQKIAENEDPDFTKAKWRPAPIFYLITLSIVYTALLVLLGYGFYQNESALLPFIKSIFNVKDKEILNNLYSPVYYKAWTALATGMLFALHAFTIHGLLRAKRLAMIISTFLLSFWSIGVADYLLHKQYPIGSFSFIIGWTGFIASIAVVLICVSKRMRHYAVRRILR